MQSLRQTAGGAFCTDRSGVSFRRQLCYRLSGARWWYPQLQVGTLGRRLTDVDRRDLIHPPTRWLPELKQTPKRCGRDDSTNGERCCMRTPPGPSISRIAYISTDAHCRLAHGQSAQTQLAACYPISFRICTFLMRPTSHIPFWQRESTERGKKELQCGDCGRPSE